MNSNILPHTPRTRKMAWLEDKINQPASDIDGPQFLPGPTDEAEMERRGYRKVKTVGGYEWQKPIEIKLPKAEQKPATIYDLARECVEGGHNWARGFSREIWQNNGHVASVEYSPAYGDLALTFHNGDPNRVTKVRCARLAMFVDGANVTGYVWTLSRDDYAAWVEEAKAL